jgi:hypothetical protein
MMEKTVPIQKITLNHEKKSPQVPLASRLGARISTSRELVELTPGTAFAGSGNRAIDTSSPPGKGAADTPARIRNRAHGKYDRSVFALQEVQHVPPRKDPVRIVPGRFRGEAPRLRGAVIPEQ